MSVRLRVEVVRGVYGRLANRMLFLVVNLLFWILTLLLLRLFLVVTFSRRVRRWVNPRVVVRLVSIMCGILRAMLPDGILEWFLVLR